MKQSRYTDLKQAESGSAITDLCRKNGMRSVACLVFSILLGCYHYQRKLSDENVEIADWLLPLTSINNTLGFGLFFIFT